MCIKITKRDKLYCTISNIGDYIDFIKVEMKIDLLKIDHIESILPKIHDISYTHTKFISLLHKIFTEHYPKRGSRASKDY